MAKPTQEEINKIRRNLEAQLMGGTTEVMPTMDLMGIPGVKMPSTYIEAALPPGLSLSQVSGVKGIQQTQLDKLTDLMLELENIEKPMTSEESKRRRQEIYELNYQDYIGKPLSTEYGTLQEKAKGPSLTPYLPEIEPAPSISKTPTEPPSLLTPFRPQVKSFEPVVEDVDWDVITKGYQEETKVDDKTARKDIAEFKKQFNVFRELHPEYTIEKSFEEFNKLSESFKDVKEIEKPEEIQKRFEQAGDGALAKAFSKQLEERGEMPLDYTPEQMAFVKRQLTDDFNQARGNALDGLKKNREVKGIRITTDPATGGAIDVPLATYQAIMLANPKLPTYQPIYDTEIDAKIREGIPGKEVKTTVGKGLKQELGYARGVALTTVGNPNAWYLNPETKKMVLENPEQYIQEGWISDVSPFGDIKESNTMYGLRMLMSPLNVIAGGLQEYVLEPAVGGVIGTGYEAAAKVGLIPESDYFTTGIGMTEDSLSAKRQRQRAKDTPLYENNPILANVALNKGFTGEAEDLTKSLNLTGAAKYAVIGGGFLTDIASPDIGMIAAAGKAAKVGAPVIGDAARINKAMYGTSGKAIDNALEGLKAGRATFMDDLNGISAILKEDTFLTKGAGKVAESKLGKVAAKVPGAKTTAKGIRKTYEFANIPYASVTAKVADTNAEVLKAQRLIKQGQDPVDALKNLPDTHPYKIDVLKSQNPAEVDAFKFISDDPNNAKILKEWDETQNAIKDLDEFKIVDGKPVEKNIDDIIDASGLSREFLDSLAVAKTGKRFTSLSDLGMEAGDLAKVVDQRYARLLTMNTLGPKNLADLNKIFAITRNTWAHKDSIGKVIAGANETPLGQVLAKIRNTQKVASVKPTTGGIPFFGRKTAPQLASTEGAVRTFGDRKIVESVDVVPTFDLTPELLEKLKNIIPEDMAELANSIFKDGKLDFNEFNVLVNRNIDNYAKSAEGAFTGDELSLLSDKAQHIILEQGNDGLLTRGARKLISIAKKEITDVENPLPMTTIQQKQLMKNVRSRASAMDTQLRRELDLLMPNNDDYVRELYGITQPKGQKLTSEEAISYAIIGKRQATVTGKLYNKLDKQKTVDEICNWLTARLFYTKQQPIGLFSQVDGSSQLAYRQLLNGKGQEEMDKIVGQLLNEIDGDSSKLIEGIFGNGGVIDQYELLLKNKQYLNVTVDPAKIVKVPKAEKGQTKLIIGMYYKSEGERIIAGEIAKAINENVLKTDLKAIVGNQLHLDYNRIMGTKMTNTELVRHTNEMIERLCKRNLNAPHTSIWDYIQAEAVEAGIMTGGAKTADEFADLVRQLPDEAKRQVDVLARFIRKSEETAETILKNNGLSHNKFDTDMDGVQELFNHLGTKGDKAKERLAEAILGKETYNEFNKLISEGKLATLTDELDNMLKETTLLKAGLNLAHNFFTGVNRFFYPMILSLRASFHGGNIFSAPFIAYQTTGSLAGFNPRLVNRGRRLAFSAMTPQDRYFYEIATIDKTGKVWTYGELNRLMKESGIESQVQAITSLLGSDQLERYILKNTKNRNAGKKLWDGITSISDKAGEITIKEDLMFRSTVLLEALEDGKSIDEALLAARQSLFDYKDISDWEKSYVARYLVFYSFFRANLGHFIKSMGDATKLKTYLNTLKLKRGNDIVMARALDDDYIDDRFFFEDKFTAKFFLLATESEDKRKIAITTPSIPALDAPVQFFQMMYDPINFVNETAQGLLRPSIKKLLDVKGKFDYQYRTVPPEFVALKGSTPQEVAAFWEGLLGGDIAPRQGTQDEGAIDGWIYPLDDKQAKKLKQYESILDGFGVIAMYKDYYNIFSGQGTTRQDIPAVAVPFTKQSVIRSQRELELGNIRARKKAIEQQLSDYSYQLKKKRSE